MSNGHSDTAGGGPDNVIDVIQNPHYSIRINITEIKPQNQSCFDRLCKRGGKPALIVGKRFTIQYQLTNVSHRDFPGGDFLLSIRWPGERVDWYRKEISPLSDGESTELDILSYGVLEPGYGMVYAKGKPYSDFEQIQRPWKDRNTTYSFHIFRGDRDLGDGEVHITSVFGQTVEEFYQLIGLIVAVIGLSYPLLKDIIGLLFSWLP